MVWSKRKMIVIEKVIVYLTYFFTMTHANTCAVIRNDTKWKKTNHSLDRM